MNNTDTSRETLKSLRWIQRAAGLLAELDRTAALDPDVAAVQRALARQMQLEQDRLRSLGTPMQDRAA